MIRVLVASKGTPLISDICAFAASALRKQKAKISEYRIRVRISSESIAPNELFIANLFDKPLVAVYASRCHAEKSQQSVPVYLVPLAILLHLASLKKLRHATAFEAVGPLDGVAFSLSERMRPIAKYAGFPNKMRYR